MNKKGQRSFSIGDLSSIGITLLILAIILGIGATILSTIQDNQNAGTSGYNVSNPGSWSLASNITDGGQIGITTIANYQGTVALIAVAAVIIGVVMMFFGRGSK